MFGFLGFSSNTSSNRQTRRQANRRRSFLEQLENRDLMATVSVQLPTDLIDRTYVVKEGDSIALTGGTFDVDDLTPVNLNSGTDYSVSGNTIQIINNNVGSSVVPRELLIKSTTSSAVSYITVIDDDLEGGTIDNPTCGCDDVMQSSGGSHGSNRTGAAYSSINVFAPSSAEVGQTSSYEGVTDFSIQHSSANFAARKYKGQVNLPAGYTSYSVQVSLLVDATKDANVWADGSSVSMSSSTSGLSRFEVDFPGTSTQFANLPTGAQQIRITVNALVYNSNTNQWDTALSNTSEAMVGFVNESDDGFGFGQGWSLGDAPRLLLSDPEFSPGENPPPASPTIGEITSSDYPGLVLQMSGGASVFFAKDGTDGTWDTSYYPNTSIPINPNGGLSFKPASGDFKDLTLKFDPSTSEFKLSQPDGSQTVFNLDGSVKSSTDDAGNLTTYSYNSSKKLTSYSTPERSVTFTHSGTTTSITDSLNSSNTTTLTRDAQGRVIEVLYPDPDGTGALAAPKETFGYTGSSKIITTRIRNAGTANPETTTFAYDATSSKISSITYPNGMSQQFFPIGSAALTAVGDTYARTIVTGNPNRGLGGTITNLSVSVETRTYYNTDGKVTKRIENYVDGNPNTGALDEDVTSITEYYAAGDQIGGQAVTDKVIGRVKRELSPDPDGAGSLTSQITTYEYDLTTGNLTKTTSPNGKIEQLYYEDSVNPDSVTKRLESYNEYTPAGAVNAKTRDSRYTYDTNGNMLSQREIVGAFDGQGNSETNDLVTTWQYNVPAWNPTTQTGVKVKGLPSSMTDPMGRRTDYTYTPEGAIQTTTYAANFPTQSVSTSKDYYTDYYTGTTRVKRETDQRGTKTAYIYDSLGRLKTKIENVQGSYPDSGTFDPASSPSSPSTDYEYDATGRITKILEPYVTSFDSTVNLGAGLNRRTHTFAYSSNGNYTDTTQDNNDANTNLTISSYYYDNLGRVSYVTDARNQTTYYEYDNLGRLVKTQTPDPIAGDGILAPVSVTEYDGMGRKSKSYMLKAADGNAWPEAVDGPTTNDDDYKTLYTYPDARTSVVTGPKNVTGVNGVRSVTTSMTDELGNVVKQIRPTPGDISGTSFTSSFFAYDELGRRTKTILPKPGTSTTFDASVVGYDKNGNVSWETTQIDATTSRTTDFTYDVFNRLSTRTDADPDAGGPLTRQAWSYAYDAAGNMTSETDPLNRVTQYEYDNLNRQTKIKKDDPTNPNSGAPYFGKLIWEKTYDNLGRVTREYEPPKNTQAAADNPAFPATSSQPHIRDFKIYVYDVVGGVAGISSDIDGLDTTTGDRPTLKRIYDAGGNLVQETDQLNRKTFYTYNGPGNLTKITKPAPNTSTPGITPEVNYTYDYHGQRTKETDELGNLTDFSFDRLGRLLTRLDADPDGTGPKTRPATTYAYAISGDRLSLTDPVNNSTTWNYDVLGRVAIEGNALSFNRYFQYDYTGARTGEVDRLGRFVKYEYDHVGRMTNERWYPGSSLQSGVYVPSGTESKNIAFVYDAANRLTSAGDSGYSLAYTYDDIDRPLAQTGTRADGLAPNVTLTSEWTDDGNRSVLKATIGATNDFKNDYSYDRLNRLTQVVQQGQSGGNSVAVKNVKFLYNWADQITDILRYADTAGTATKLVAQTYFTLDGQGRTSKIQHMKPWGSNIVTYDIRYEDGGDTVNYANGGKHDRIEKITDTYSGNFGTNAAWSGTHDYTYDNNDQLTGAQHQVTTITDETYDYDANGNRLKKNNGPTFDVRASNQTFNDNVYTYTYDNEGNRLTRTTTATGIKHEYTWDNRNRLTLVTIKNNAGTVTKTVAYEYDANNRLIRRTEDPDGATGSAAIKDRFFAYDGNQSVLEWKKDGSNPTKLSDRNLWGPVVDQLLAHEQIDYVSGAATNYWPLTDHLGTIKDLATFNNTTNATTVVKHREFDSFGNIALDSAPSITEDIGYTGRYYDKETEIQWNLNRWYDPKLGQWLSEDPMGFAAGDENLRRYVGNSSLNAIDPSGLMPPGYSPGGPHPPTPGFSPLPATPKNDGPQFGDERTGVIARESPSVPGLIQQGTVLQRYTKGLFYGGKWVNIGNETWNDTDDNGNAHIRVFGQYVAYGPPGDPLMCIFGPLDYEKGRENCLNIIGPFGAVVGQSKAPRIPKLYPLNNKEIVAEKKTIGFLVASMKKALELLRTSGDKNNEQTQIQAIATVEGIAKHLDWPILEE